MDLFPVTPETKKAIYQIYKTSEEEVKEDVEKIKEWLKKQPHLPQKLPYDNFIEQFLLNNKFNVKRTQQRIDDHFTIKTIYHYFFKDLSSNPDLNNVGGAEWFYVMPKLGPNYERIIIVRMVDDPNPLNFDFAGFIRRAFAFFELFMRYNFSNNMTFILDFQDCSFGHLKKWDLVKYARSFDVITAGYSSRYNEFIVLNAPLYFDILQAAIGMFTSQKILDKFGVCPDLRTLHKKISPEYLPKEYGGQMGSTAEYRKRLSEAFEDHKTFFKDCEIYKSDEKLRIGKCRFQVLEGIDETFRKIDID